MTHSFTPMHWKPPREMETVEHKAMFQYYYSCINTQYRENYKGDWLMITLTSRDMITRDILHHKEVHMLLHIKNRNWQSAKFWAEKEDKRSIIEYDFQSGILTRQGQLSRTPKKDETIADDTRHSVYSSAQTSYNLMEDQVNEIQQIVSFFISVFIFSFSSSICDFPS